MKRVVCFGEVLWDVFPDSKNIGGAPLNVAVRLQSFGIDAKIISKIGIDKNGNDIISYLNNKNICTKNIQTDELLSTGTVSVKLNNQGSASYEINYPVAWDKIRTIDKSINLVKSSNVFVYGSLACRDDVSKNSLMKYIKHAQFKVFDVNLRSPHYSIDLILELLIKSDLVKFNDDELTEICTLLNFHNENQEEQIKWIAQKTNTSMICVTMGKEGALLYKEDNFYYSKKYKINVSDTVGAGDSFLGALIYKILFNQDLSNILNFSVATGALVASKKGANPDLSTLEIEKFMFDKS